MSVNKDSVVNEVITNISAKYGIEQAIMDDFRLMMLSVLTPYYLYTTPASKVAAKGSRKAKATAAAGGDDASNASKAEKKPRQTSAYNVYVCEMMQVDSVKTAPQKEKMALIGNMWKALSDSAKDVYKQRAAAKNAAAPVAAAAAPAAPAAAAVTVVAK
jgi:hypothetical protein